MGLFKKKEKEGGGGDGEKKEKEKKKEPGEDKLTAPEGFAGPNSSSRGCTDVLCFLLLIANWVSLTALGFVVLGVPGFESDVLPPGDPYRLINGMDYLGQICGVPDSSRTRVDNETGLYKKFDVSSKSKAYYLPSGVAVCVSSCPSVDDYDRYICNYDMTEVLDGYVAERDDWDYWWTGFKAVKAYECSFVFATTDYMGYCVFNAGWPDFASAFAASAPRAWPDPTSFPTPAPTYPPTSARPIPAPTPAPSYNGSALCTEGDRGMCEDNREHCGALFCPDCVLPGFCDFTCGYCAPQPTAAPTTEAFLLANRAAEDPDLFQMLSADLYVAHGYILGFGLGVATLIGFAYLLLLRIPGLLALIIWSCLAAVCALIVLLGALILNTAEQWKAEDPQLHEPLQIKICRYAGLGTLGLAGVYALVIVVLRKRIMLALGVVKEACRAVAALPLLTAFPLFQVAGLLCFMFPWFIYAFFLASSAEVVIGEVALNDEVTIQTKDFAYTEDQKKAALYLIFSYFWTSEFIVAMGQLVVALAISGWYFAKDRRHGSFDSYT